MKKILLITLASTSLIAAYFFVKNCGCFSCSDSQQSDSKPSRHLTNAFSKAKQQAVS